MTRNHSLVLLFFCLLFTGCARDEPVLALDGGGGDGLGRTIDCAPAIDGEFTHLGDEECGALGFEEWPVEPVRGRFGDLYVEVRPGGELVVLNDWHLRDDAPADPEMYNLFCLQTNIGLFEVRVFGDDRVEAWRDGERWTEIEAAAGFAPSPLTPEPHSIFEFALAALPETMVVYEKDPSAGPIGVAAPDPSVRLAESGTCFEGSAPEIPHNLVTEPTRFRFELSESGVVSAGPTDAPLLLTADRPTVRGGETLTLFGVGLSEMPGQVRIADVTAPVLLWRDDRATFEVPDVTGRVSVQVEVLGVVSNPLTVTVEPPASGCVPECFGECGADGCGGSCGSCPGGAICDEEEQICTIE